MENDYHFFIGMVKDIFSHPSEYALGSMFISPFCLGIIGAALVLGWLLGLVLRRLRPGRPARPFLYASLLLILAGLISGLLPRTDVMSMDLALCFLPPVFVVLAFSALVVWLRRRGFGKILKTSALLWCAFAAGLVLCCGLSSGLNAWRYAAARAYVERAMPVLDKIKAEKGAYPATLPIASLGEPPVLVQGAYHSTGQEFSFWCDDPVHFMGYSYVFYSSERVWHGQDFSLY